VTVLKAREELPLNADPILAVEAMEALHSDNMTELTSFALDLHNLGAAQFFSVGVTTVNFLTIKEMELRTGNPNAYLQNALTYIQAHGVAFANHHSVDAHALNHEVERYLSETLMPVLNGVGNLSLDFPTDAPEHTRQYVLALTYVTYAFYITAHGSVTGGEVSFNDLRKQIESKTEQFIQTPENNLVEMNPDVPQEPLNTSHFGIINRSSFQSPAHEATSTVDVSIPLQLSAYYSDSNKDAINETVEDVASGKLDIEVLLKPTLHFCRAILIIVFNMTSQADRDSYMAAANANITKSRMEGLVTHRFGVEQRHIDVAIQSILMTLSSLMMNHGSFYEGNLPDPDSAEYRETVFAYIVGLGMVADAYSVLVTGRLGLSEKEFAEKLYEVLN
jgi:hypothetical protein